ncbi:MAG TPA: response regulator transcription factor [Niabella sp.]|nr:response regulator transcription factor [Niabella sp.]
MKKTTTTFAIVDDHELMRETTRSMLLLYGYEVILEAVNGKDLIHQLQYLDQLPHVCLLDLNMPEMNGYETTRFLRKNFPSIRILAFSQFARDSQVKEILACGAEGFLPKESDPERWEKELKKISNQDL